MINLDLLTLRLLRHNRSIHRFHRPSMQPIIALRDACKFLGNYRLPGAELFVTLEPCTMCVGAIIHARIKRVVFAALDSRSGAVCSCSETFDQKYHNHHVKWAHGLLAEESANLLRSFFLERR